MIRVGFLALQAPGLSPGQRYRVEAFLPFLKSTGIDVDYAWLLDADDLRFFYGHSGLIRKGATAALGLYRRARSLLDARHWNVVFVQREAFFLLNEWAERLASLLAPVVFDFDDAIWIHAVSDANRRFAFLKNVEKIPRLARLAHTVIAGNEYLAEWARRHNDNVHVIPTCVDTEVYRPPRSAPAPAPSPSGGPAAQRPSLTSGSSSRRSNASKPASATECESASWGTLPSVTSP